jgi:circadian clock protein KaiB
MRKNRPAKRRPKWRLRLYTAGKTSRSMEALQNLRRLCEEKVPGQYEIEVIDLLKSPQLAKGQEIVAVPTLVRQLPTPIRKIIGTLSDRERVLVGLQMSER